MIRCSDNSIYTGITTDIKRRFNEHQSKDEKCAKYTMSHDVKKIEAVWKTENKILASKLEYRIKELTKAKKEELIKDNNCFYLFFSNKLECGRYNRYLLELT